MIDIKELDEQTIIKAAIVADELGISLADFFKIIDAAKRDFKNNYLS